MRSARGVLRDACGADRCLCDYNLGFLRVTGNPACARVLETYCPGDA
jgi:hypothetical protein